MFYNSIFNALTGNKQYCQFVFEAIFKQFFSHFSDVSFFSCTKTNKPSVCCRLCILTASVLTLTLKGNCTFRLLQCIELLLFMLVVTYRSTLRNYFAINILAFSCFSVSTSCKTHAIMRKAGKHLVFISSR